MTDRLCSQIRLTLTFLSLHPHTHPSLQLAGRSLSTLVEHHTSQNHDPLRLRLPRSYPHPRALRARWPCSARCCDCGRVRFRSSSGFQLRSAPSVGPAPSPEEDWKAIPARDGLAQLNADRAGAALLSRPAHDTPNLPLPFRCDTHHTCADIATY